MSPGTDEYTNGRPPFARKMLEGQKHTISQGEVNEKDNDKATMLRENHRDHPN